MMTKENEENSSPDEKNNENEAPDNLIDVAWKSEEYVVSCLERRVRSGKFYTWAGTTLVAVNPCRPVSELYDEAVNRQYAQPEAAGGACLAPHAWAVAARAWAQVRRGAGDQVLVVSGDSGAGKTHTAWLMLDFLSAMGEGGGGGSGAGGDGGGVEALRLLRGAGPLLTAMGHAHTQLNRNSSRFGSMLSLRFAPAERPREHRQPVASTPRPVPGSVSSPEEYEVPLVLAGARVQTFLLEKSRAAAPAHGERNFHVFYQMLWGLSPEERKELRLPLGKEFRIAPDADPSDCDAHAAALRETLRCLQALSSPAEVAAVLRLLAALLHLGEVHFAAPTTSDSDEDLDASQGACAVDSHVPGSAEALEAAASLLGLEDASLEALLTSALVAAASASQKASAADARERDSVSSLRRRRTLYRRLLATRAECEARRDCLVRFLYERAFRWALRRANARLAPRAAGHDVGVLDLFGFEVVSRNSLEQLCINYAAERLQLALLRSLAERARDAHEAAAAAAAAAAVKTEAATAVEGIGPAKSIATGLEACVVEAEAAAAEAEAAAAEKTASDAEQRLQLLDGHESVFSVLDQESVLQRRVLLSCPGGDAAGARAGALALALHETLRGRRFFAAQRSSAAAAAARAFAVRHFPATVVYDAHGLLEKNLDRVPAEFAEALAAGGDAQVAAVVTAAAAAADDTAVEMCTPSQRWKSPLSLNPLASTPGTPRARPSLTLLSKFKVEVDALVARLAAAESHHVRCVKAAERLQPHAVDAVFLKKQLAAAGLLEATRYALERFPLRLHIEDFRRRYGSLPNASADGEKPEDASPLSETRDAAGGCRQPLPPQWVRVGRRSVYLTEAAAAALEAERRRRLDAAARVLQRAWRRGAGGGGQSTRRGLAHRNSCRPKQLQAAAGGQALYRGDRILSRRPLAKTPIWFHTKETCLPFSHVVPFWELPQGLVDLI